MRERIPPVAERSIPESLDPLREAGSDTGRSSSGLSIGWAKIPEVCKSLVRSVSGPRDGSKASSFERSPETRAVEREVPLAVVKAFPMVLVYISVPGA